MRDFLRDQKNHGLSFTHEKRTTCVCRRGLECAMLGGGLARCFCPVGVLGQKIVIFGLQFIVQSSRVVKL